MSGAEGAVRHCQVCDGGQAQPRRIDEYSISKWPVTECPSCGFVFLERAPDYKALSVDQAWEKNYFKEAKKRRKKAIYRVDQATRFRLELGKMAEVSRVRSVLGTSGRVLDVGCGDTVRVPKGFTPYGIEVSEGLVKRAKPRFEALGGTAVHAPAPTGLDAFEDNFFSGILMRSYLEHEVEPRKVLQKAFAKLKPGGSILIKVPNYACFNRHVMGVNWCGFRFPDHVNYFTGRTLRQLAESIGFTYKSKTLAPFFDDNIWVALSKS